MNLIQEFEMLVVVVFLDPFREMKARSTSTEAQQSGNMPQGLDHNKRGENGAPKKNRRRTVECEVLLLYTPNVPKWPSKVVLLTRACFSSPSLYLLLYFFSRD